jgi:hypothetical protein
MDMSSPDLSRDPLKRIEKWIPSCERMTKQFVLGLTGGQHALVGRVYFLLACLPILKNEKRFVFLKQIFISSLQAGIKTFKYLSCIFIHINILTKKQGVT